MTAMTDEATLTFAGATQLEPHRAPRRPAMATVRQLIEALADAEPGTSDVDRLAADLTHAVQSAFSRTDALAADAARKSERADAALARALAMHGQLDGERRELDAERARMIEERAMMRERIASLQNQVTTLHQAMARRRGIRPPGPVIRDREGCRSQRPDPSAATTGAELMDCLRAWHKWAGNPSIRQIAAGSGRRISPTQVHTLLTRREMPARLGQLDAIIQGCGGTDEDRAAWADAWRVLFAARP